MTKRKPQPIPTKDSFVNFATRTGIGTDNMSSANSYGFNPISRIRLLIEWMYRGSWICGVGVDCVADDMTREGIEVQGMDASDADRLQTCLQTRQVAQSLNEVAKWARLYGGALGVIGIKGQDYSTPLRLETVGKDQFEGITVMDRWMVNPDLMTGITQPGPDFGLPPSYDVVARSFQFPFPQGKVHHTRIIRMEGLSLPFWQKQSENMWGISVLERVYDRLTAFDSVTQGAAQLAYRSYLRTLKIENLREIIAAGGKQYESMLAQIELIRRYQANEGVTLLDAKDDFATHSYTFAGLSDLLNSMGDQISGALQVPIARLFGQSPGGMNSTGDHELRTYYDNVKRLQERWFRRPLDVVLRVAAASEGITIPEGFKYDYVSLWQMTDKEKAEKNASDVSAIKTADDMGLPKRVILQELKKAGQSTGYWTSITEEDIKEAEKEDAEMPSAAELLMQGKEANGEDENDKGEAHAHAIEETQDASIIEQVREKLYNEYMATGNVMKRFPKQADGRVTEEVRVTPEWKEARKKYDAAFAAYRNFNAKYKPSRDSARIFDWHGIPIHLETLQGEWREGGAGAYKWAVRMPCDYGFIAGIPSAEGAMEELDCYVGTSPDSTKVWIINQINADTRNFDEHKCMLAFATWPDAKAAYLAAHSDGRGAERLGSMVALDLEEFKAWMKTHDMRRPS